MTATIRYYPGDGYGYDVDVFYISNFPRGDDRTCAFCHGDPLNERKKSDTNIALYYERRSAETCPMCDGRPT